MPNAEASATTSHAIARQAILTDRRAVFGYELLNRAIAPYAHTAYSDAKFLFNAMTDGEIQPGSKTFFINCTHDTLAGGHLDLVSPEHIVLEIPPLPNPQADDAQNHLPALQAMRDRGFALSFDHHVLDEAHRSWLPLASYIKFDMLALAPNSMAMYVHLAQLQSKAQLIAQKVESEAQFAQASNLGIQLFQGHWFAKPVLLEGHSIRPGQAAILQLIDLVRRQASTDAIEAVLKHDPSLSFNLLRFINSAGFGARAPVTSFKHAVMLLGLQRLFRWAALLMTTSQMGHVPPAVGTAAVVRGRLMELLCAEALPADERDNAFVVGVFSLLDTMLGVSMETALSTVSLPDSVTQALLDREGPLAPYLELTIACESEDSEGFAQRVQELSLTAQQVNWAHLQALDWAETLSA